MRYAKSTTLTEHTLKLWTNISNIGTHQNDTPEYLRKIHLLNQMCFLAILTTFFFVGPLFFVKHYYYVYFQILTGLLVSFSFILSSRRLFNLALYWMFVTLMSNIFYCSIEIPNSGVEYFLIPLSIVPFIIINNNKICIGLMLLAILTFLISFSLKKNYHPHVIISLFNTELLFIMTLLSTFLLCVIIVFQFKVINQKFELIISKQKTIVENKNREITDSINYAKLIQEAKLPDRKQIYATLPNSFILFKPKDIVSGDFYYFYKNNQSVFIASADCTGHGVPGALMSMVGFEKLDDALAHSSDTSEILKQLNKGIKTSLRQSDSNGSTRDGMDIAICSIDTNSRIVKYAGANRPIWIIRNGETVVEEIKATKKAIGGFTEDSQHFDSHEIKLQQGDTFYIATDGYADTFGGQEQKKVTTKRFKEILLSIQDKTMKEQERHLDNFIEDWKGGTEQIDDILVIGVRL